MLQKKEKKNIISSVELLENCVLFFIETVLQDNFLKLVPIDLIQKLDSHICMICEIALALYYLFNKRHKSMRHGTESFE